MTPRAIAQGAVWFGVAPQVAVGCAARGTDSASVSWVGEVGWSGEEEPFFDLASLTKPLTAVAVARSGIDLRAPLGELWGEARGTATEKVPLELLLSHRGGMASHLPLWTSSALGRGAWDRARALLEVANARVVDSAAVYSDLGYILVGEALARHVGARDAGVAIEQWVIEPLGLGDALGTARSLRLRGVGFDERVAPTEEAAWRGGVVRGEVHDENAWVLTRDGGSGHAGIFGTASAVLLFAEAVLDSLDGRGAFGERGKGRDLSFLIEPRPGGDLRAGFDGKSRNGSSAGSRFGDRSFGHLGFTGTSLWIDPDAKIIATALTNRVHPSRSHEAIRWARPLLHDALFDRALGLRGSSAAPAFVE